MRSSATTLSNSCTAVPTGIWPSSTSRARNLSTVTRRTLKRTRTSRWRYRFDYEEADHHALLALLDALPCQAMVSGYACALHDERLSGWHRVELQVMNQGGVRTECVWFNFTPDRLHWARYAGKNFTDRQRIKRKTQS